MTRLALLFPLLLAACGWVDYDNLPEGEIQGTLLVMWVDEGSDDHGDGRFLFIPDPDDPLRLIRGAGATPTEIRPEMIYTDGGSIPKAAQLFRGFSPWGYAPAYMIHDWLFVARHCLTDAKSDSDIVLSDAKKSIEGMEFQESAEIIGEAIEALIASGKVREDDRAPRVIAGAVAGPISYDRWHERGVCKDHEIDPEHLAEAQRRVPGSAPGALQRSKALTAPGAGAIAGVAAIQSVRTTSQVVAKISF